MFAKWVLEYEVFDPKLVIREGKPVLEILVQVSDNPKIGVFVLAAGTDSKGLGPLVTQLTKSLSSLPIPITMVPVTYSKNGLRLSHYQRLQHIAKRLCLMALGFWPQVTKTYA